MAELVFVYCGFPFLSLPRPSLLSTFKSALYSYYNFHPHIVMCGEVGTIVCSHSVGQV